MSSKASSLPTVFIGSTKEAMGVAKAVRNYLFHEADGIVWSDPEVFSIGEVALESLEAKLKDAPFGIFVMSPDDMVISRKTKSSAPRDNLIFELGLWAGRHGRHSAFMVVPHGEKVRLPSDLLGINVGEYKTRTDSGEEKYDVGTACDQILSSIKKLHKRDDNRSPLAGSLNFWGVLSETIVIAYGVEQDAEADPKKHFRISLRDLGATYEIANFLTRHYPGKSVLSIAAGEEGWQKLLHDDTSLVIVGGFVTNSAFATYHSKMKGSYSLRMGRLCGLEGRLSAAKQRRAFHLEFKTASGIDIPARNDPQALDNISSDYIARDYGLVTNCNAIINGKKRRVITVAGIKGYGTLGAAKALTGTTDQPVSLGEILESQVKEGDSLEMIIATDVGDHAIDRTEVIELARNGKRTYWAKKRAWEICELGWPCKGCTYGTRLVQLST